MTVLFGTVEYFEREIMNDLQCNISLSDITTKLEDELLYDFICDERIRVECLNNLKTAICTFKQDQVLKLA